MCKQCVPDILSPPPERLDTRLRMTHAQPPLLVHCCICLHGEHVNIVTLHTHSQSQRYR